MNERETFLDALNKNEDDTSVRLAFADWLDEQGEHEEADRHRKWPASKAWIIGFCEEYQPGEFHDFDPLTYSEIMDQALEAIVNSGLDEKAHFLCGSNMGLCYSDQWHEFWKHWSIVSGIALKPEFVKRISYSCAC